MIKLEVFRGFYSHGFNEHYGTEVWCPVEEWLPRYKIDPRATNIQPPFDSSFKKIIAYNSSLRINLGWSCESPSELANMLTDVINDIQSDIMDTRVTIVVDDAASWFGFVPHNTFEEFELDKLSTYGLIVYNDNLIKIQHGIVEGVADHKIFKRHALLKDRYYRFQYFKKGRKDNDCLSKMFHEYITASIASNASRIPRDYVEEDVGVHFLGNPALFSELLNFYILKGDIYEW